MKNSYFLLLLFFISQTIMTQTSIEWEQNYGGSSRETLDAILPTDDGGFLLAGESESSDGDVGGNHGKFDYWVVKIDSLSNLEWEQNYGGSDIDRLKSLNKTDDGGFLLAGTSHSDDVDLGDVLNISFQYWVVKINSTGNIEWQRLYGGSREILRSVVNTKDGGFLLGGSSSSAIGDVGGNNGNDDFWVSKINLTELIETGIPTIEPTHLTVYPNPNEGILALQ